MSLIIEMASEPAMGCPCCDPMAAAPQGYVSRNGEPTAVYFADWMRTPVPNADLVVSVGRWDELSKPEDRRAMAFRLTPGEDGVEIRIMDARKSRWGAVGFAGAMLDEQAARRDPDLAEFRALALAIAEKDERIADALAGPASCSLRFSRRPGTVQRFHVEAAEWR
ncbi:hypothetical protein [Breoghania sp.]|uniref:hypothetical protein n=1 Tax=Breoghania sp. TaxID=2065378 RepID=UPI002AA932A1|nr:hypothetical protein [Breoghania sp.]